MMSVNQRVMVFRFIGADLLFDRMPKNQIFAVTLRHLIQLIKRYDNETDEIVDAGRHPVLRRWYFVSLPW
jgi:hypothetical protein